MKTTARNVLSGIVDAVTPGPVTTQVLVAVPGGHQVAATMTTAAAERLKLSAGNEALVLIKSSAVVLVLDFAGHALSARNQFPGTISRVERGAVSSLIGLTLPGGTILTASVTNDAVDALALMVGMEATAVFKAYSVMVAVAAQ
ncbi:transporter [Paraburkholderia bannensis]|nr:TOBE domain-containing protein [Paraburkholderia bannensis]RQM44612.1 transporter [Paraburkholderia bannensis]